MWDRKKPESLINPFKPEPINPDKRYVRCANCGKAIPEKLILNHYKFCAIATPPSEQPFRD
jgi:hypothetical protein